MSMSRKKCCVPGCMESGNSHPTMHLFPNPAKEIKRFNEWVYSIGSDILGLDNNDIFKHRSVCHAHFEEKYCCRFNRLSNIAVPTLNLPGSISLPKFTFHERRLMRDIQNCSSTTPSTLSCILQTCSPGPFHQFPNPCNSERFDKWKSVLSESFVAKGDQYIYNCLRLCDCHFEHCYRSSSKRLTRNAIPTLNLYHWSGAKTSRSKHVDHNYTGTDSEGPLNEGLASDSKNDDSKSHEVNMMNLEDPLAEKLTSFSKSHDDVMVDLADPLDNRIPDDLCHLNNDTSRISLKDPLTTLNADADMEDALVEEWIDDTELCYQSMSDSEDPLRERLTNDTQHIDDDVMGDSDDTMSESDDGLLTAKYKLLELFASLDEVELDTIEQWICSKAYKKDLEQKISLLKKEDKLVKISKSLKKVLPFEAEFTSEKIIPPTVGNQADCNEYNTCHIDEFLYDEDDVEKLVETGKVKRHYCLDCHSRNTKALTYISHSMSRQAVQYIFTVLLPKDLEDKQVLDIGSRIGAVLYGAYYFSNAGAIIGIEMNKECCDIQNRILSEFSIDKDRMKIVHSDVMDRSDIVSNSDVIVINNPDFFIDIETHKKMWYFLKKYIKKGSYIVSSRSVTATLDSLGLFDELIDWLRICKPHQQDNEILFDIEDYNEIFLYAVN